MGSPADLPNELNLGFELIKKLDEISVGSGWVAWIA